MPILQNLLGTRSGLENPLRPLTNATLLEALGGVRTHTGISVNTETAVRFIAVYRAVSLVSGAIAALPLKARRQGSQRTPYFSPLLADPHATLTSLEVWETILFSMLLSGHGFAQKVRNGASQIIELDPLPTGSTHARTVKVTRDNPWGVEFDVTHDDGRRETLSRYEIFHVPGPFGLSPIGVARQGIGVGLAAEEYEARLYGSGALVGGVLQTDQELDEPQAERLKLRMKERLTGLAHSHEIAVLDKGAKFVPVGMHPKDAEFIESRKFQVTEIARLYGIPPHLLGDVEGSTSWGTGIEQQSIGFVVYTLTPWMSRIEQRLSKECLPTGIEVDFDTKGLLRGDIKTRYEAYSRGISGGFLQPSEARQDEDLPFREGTDELWMPMNLRPVSQPASLKEQIDAAGALVRAGYDPMESLKLVGLDPIEHLGFLPVTVQSPSKPAPTRDAQRDREVSDTSQGDT